jgi:hypothetical protein
VVGNTIDYYRKERFKVESNPGDLSKINRIENTVSRLNIHADSITFLELEKLVKKISREYGK